MMSEQKDLELIEAYLLKKLDESARDEVNERLTQDESFRTLFKEIETIILGVQSESRKSLLDQFQRLEDDHFGTPVIEERFSLFRSYGVAASVLLAVSIGLAWYFLPSTPDHVQVFEAHFQALPNQIVPTTRDTKLPTKMKEEAYYQYDIGNYEAAINLLSQISKPEDDYSSLLYMGVSHLALNKAEPAIDYLREYLSEERAFSDEAQWYLFLGYVRNEQMHLGREIADKMHLTNQYKQTALSILDNIESK